MDILCNFAIKRLTALVAKQFPTLITCPADYWIQFSTPNIVHFHSQCSSPQQTCVRNWSIPSPAAPGSPWESCSMNPASAWQRGELSCAVPAVTAVHYHRALTRLNLFCNPHRTPKQKLERESTPLKVSNRLKWGAHCMPWFCHLRQILQMLNLPLILSQNR